jgi:inhibitor of growth protein 4
MSYSYASHAARLIANTESVSTSSFQLIYELDEAVTKLSAIIDQKLGQITPNSSSYNSCLSQSAQNIILDDVKKLSRIVEDLTEKKAQVAIKNYDLIDHNIKIVDHQLDILQKVKRLHPSYVPDESSSLDLSRPGHFSSHADSYDSHDMRQASQLKKFKADKESHIDDFLIDPSEPVYCICRQVAYGDMVQCDDEECEIEWFHYPCVNIFKTPKNKWLCPTCTAKRKR